MQASSSGTTDLHALVIFVVDADKPFSSPVLFRKTMSPRGSMYSIQVILKLDEYCRRANEKDYHADN